MKKTKVTVMGLGHVGSHVVRLLASSKHENIVGYDTNPAQVEFLKDRLKSPIPRYWSFHSDRNKLRHSDVWVVCVPTPIHPDNSPNLICIEDALLEIAKHIEEGDLVIIESTLGAGDIRSFVTPTLRKASNQEDLLVAYCPERYNPTLLDDVQETPRLISGITNQARDMAVKFYSALTSGSTALYAVSMPEVAELAKLYENTYRAINVAFANEVADVCRSMDVCALEVSEAAATKSFGFHPFSSGIGVGGHCIPIDPHYLIGSAENYGGEMPLTRMACLLNNKRPYYIASRIKDRFDIQKPIMVIGVTYKPNVRDTRKSPAITIIKELMRFGFDVKFYDPFVEVIEIGADSFLVSEEPTKKNVEQTLLLVEHTDMDLGVIYEYSTVLVDETTS